MASVKRRGPSWQATVRAPDGKERTKTFKLKVDADRWANDQESDIGKGLWIDPRAGRVTFGEFAETWRLAQVHRPATATLVEAHLRNHVLERFGARPLASIRPSELQTWARGLSDELAPATVELIVRYVSTIFKAAVADMLVARNPVVGVKVPQRARTVVVPLETAEVLAVIESMPDRLRGAVVLGAGAGLRQGEALGVTRDRVDFLRRQIVVDRQLVTLPGKAPYLAPPKTLASVRTVPLPDFVLEALSRHLEQFAPGREGLMFTTPPGEPIPRNRFAEVWRKAAQDAHIRPGARFHDCRHYYASLLIRHGESVKTVQARLGHASASETLDTYSHLWPDSEDRTRRAIDDVLNTQINVRAGHF